VRPRAGNSLALLSACVVALVAATGGARADRLHLAGGGIVDVDAWWIEDDLLVYRNAEGTVGLPRSVVAKVESSDPGAVGSRSPRPRTVSSAMPAANAPAPAAETRRVPPEIADRLRAATRALKERDYETAASLYHALMQDTEADFHEPRVGYAMAQIALGEDDLALSVVLDGLARDPREPRLLELRGDLRNREERVEDALRSWKDAFELSPGDRLRDKILKAERELHAGRDYALSMSSHFNLRYDGEVDLALAEAVIEFLEEQYWEMADRLDYAPRQAITVVLYPTRQFRDVTQSPEWVGGLYDGKIRVPLGGLSRLDPRAEGLLRHELTHAFVHAKSRGHCPRWLHEGLAQHFEGRTLSRRDRQGVVDLLGAVLPADWASAGFSYPAALSLTSYLEERGGLDRLTEVLRRLGEGEDPDQALTAVYGEGYAELCGDWAESVRGEGER
jgi:tetratricopeptide (TPR) repeat protein